MRLENRIVSLSSIDLSDHTFLITTERRIDELAESIKLLGLIHSPLLIPKGRMFTILSGFRRVQACLHLGGQTLSARVADPGTDKWECTQLAIADNAQQRQLNLIEVSRALNLLSGFFNDPEKLSEVGASLGLPGNLEVIKKIQRLPRLPREVQERIVSGSLSLSMALDLEKISPQDCIAFAEIFSELRISLGKQREIFSLVNEIARREGKDRLSILAGDDIHRILSDENLSRNQKASGIRSYLKQRRFPALAEAKKNFEAFQKKLLLDTRFRLLPPGDFEGVEHIIRLHFNSLDELRSHQSALGRLIENDHFKEYWSHI